jgi:hypothetical protein
MMMKLTLMKKRDATLGKEWRHAKSHFDSNKRLTIHLGTGICSWEMVLKAERATRCVSRIFTA